MKNVSVHYMSTNKIRNCKARVVKRVGVIKPPTNAAVSRKVVQTGKGNATMPKAIMGDGGLTVA